MVSFTDSAVKYLQEVLDPGDIVRVEVKGGGCSGFMYDLSVESESDIREDDATLEYDDVKVVVDPLSSFPLSETTVDYETSLKQSGFKFINRAATSTCGCGESFSCK